VDDYERKRRMQKEIAGYNEQLQEEKRRGFEAQRIEERRILHAKMEEYAEDTQRHANDRDAMRKDIQEYRLYLQRRKEEEARMEQEMERLVAEDLARANAQRDAVWDRERLAREKLMRDVYSSRAEQLIHKQQLKKEEEGQIQEEKREAEFERERAQAELEKEERLEQVTSQRRKQDLEAQMKINAYRKELEQEAAKAEKESALQAEKEYRERLVRFKKDTIETSKKNYGLKSTFHHK